MHTELRENQIYHTFLSTQIWSIFFILQDLVRSNLKQDVLKVKSLAILRWQWLKQHHNHLNTLVSQKSRKYSVFNSNKKYSFFKIQTCYPIMSLSVVYEPYISSIFANLHIFLINHIIETTIIAKDEAFSFWWSCQTRK